METSRCPIRVAFGCVTVRQPQMSNYRLCEIFKLISPLTPRQKQLLPGGWGCQLVMHLTKAIDIGATLSLPLCLHLLCSLSFSERTSRSSVQNLFLKSKKSSRARIPRPTVSYPLANSTASLCHTPLFPPRYRVDHIC